MPRKIRELLIDLVNAGFEERPGKEVIETTGIRCLPSCLRYRGGIAMMHIGITRKRFGRPSTR